jgi:hypothetical protein
MKRMNCKDAPGLIGCPEMWKPVSDRYRPLFDTAVNSLSICNEIMGQCGFTAGIELVTGSGTFASGVELTVCRMVLAASNTFGALQVLVLNGYGPDALRLSRSIHEAELNVFWLKEHPEDVEDFIGYRAIQRKQLYDQMDEEQRKLVPQATSTEILTDYERSLPRFVKPGKTKPRSEWCRVSLRDRAAANEGLLQLHLTYYPQVSSIHHGDIKGLTAQLDSEGKMDMAPSWSHLATALISGLGSFLRCLNYFDEIARLGFKDRIDILLGDYVDAVKATALSRSDNLSIPAIDCRP